MLKILGFKTEMKGATRVDWVHVASNDVMKDNGEMAVTTWLRVDRLKPKEGMEEGEKKTLMEIRWSQVEPHYEAWLKGNEIPETGTPLGAWHGVNAEQAESLRAIGIATVEALASATENQLARPPLPNMRRLRDQAVTFLEGADAAEKDKRIADLEAKLEAALELMEQGKAEPAAEKPRRGRPPKVKPESEAA